MAELTGKTRQQFYDYLADGQLDDALALVRGSKELKTSGLTPVDKSAMAIFAQRLAAGEMLRKTLASRVVDPDPAVQSAVLSLLRQLPDFPGELLQEEFERFYIQLISELLQEHRPDRLQYWEQYLERNGPRLVFETQLMLSSRVVLDDMNSIQRKQLLGIVEALTTHPTEASVKTLFAMPDCAKAIWGKKLSLWNKIGKARSKVENAVEPAVPASEPAKKSKKAKAGADLVDRLVELMREGDLEKLGEWLRATPDLGKASFDLTKHPAWAGLAGTLAQEPALQLRLVNEMARLDGDLNKLAASWLKGLSVLPRDEIFRQLGELTPRSSFGLYSTENLRYKGDPQRYRLIVQFLELLLGQLDEDLLLRLGAFQCGDDPTYNRLLNGMLTYETARLLLDQYGYPQARHAVVPYLNGAAQAFARPLYGYIGLVYLQRHPALEVTYYYDEYQIVSPGLEHSPEEVEREFQFWTRHMGSSISQAHVGMAGHFLADPAMCEVFLKPLVQGLRSNSAQALFRAYRIGCFNEEALAKLGHELMAYWADNRNAKVSHLIPETVVKYLDDPKWKLTIGTRVVAAFDSSEPEEVDTAFRIAAYRPELIREMGHNLARLAARSLSGSDREEARKSIQRLQALGELDKWPASDVAECLEQAFARKDPSIWSAAARVIQKLRENNPSLRLQNPARVREILARDPEKYGKFLAPLLD